jgi:drug/metabolite transporter (DMT)-like permease
MNPHRFKAYIYLLIMAAIWGAAGPVIKFTLQGIPCHFSNFFSSILHNFRNKTP